MPAQDNIIAGCLICGGRGFFALSCQKYNKGIYNIGVGVCVECNNSGVPGTFCQVYRQGRYQSFSIKCVNSGRSTIFKCINPALDKVWYNYVQRSFLEGVRHRNFTSTEFSEV